MPNPIFARYGNNQNNANNNILNQLARLKNNPGAILDILFQRGKINRQQYSDLQQYKNNPAAIVNYLVNNGKSTEISNAENIANSITNNTNG